MSSQAQNEANDVRAFLERMAGEAPVVATAPRRVVRRGRVRLLEDALAGLLVLALAGYGLGAVIDVAREWNRTIPAQPAPEFRYRDLRGFVPGSAETVRRIVAGSPGAERLVKWGNSGRWGASKIERIILVPSASTMREAGLETAFGTVFATERFKKTTAPNRLTVVSIAMLFPDEAIAHRGFLALRDGARAAFTGLQDLPTEGLGEEAMGVDGSLMGLPSVAYAWRVGNVVLFAGGQMTLRAEDARALAEEMNARVLAGS